MVERKAKDGIAQLDRCRIRSQIRIRATVGLNVGESALEQLFRTITRQILNEDVYKRQAAGSPERQPRRDSALHQQCRDRARERWTPAGQQQGKYQAQRSHEKERS